METRTVFSHPCYEPEQRELPFKDTNQLTLELEAKDEGKRNSDMPAVREAPPREL